jgi:hypothetical protein
MRHYGYGASFYLEIQSRRREIDARLAEIDREFDGLTPDGWRRRAWRPLLDERITLRDELAGLEARCQASGS